MSVGRRLEHDWFPRPLPENVEIGERSWCYSSFSCVHYQSQRPCGLRIGHDTGVYHGTFFDLGPEGEVEIGNYCTLVGAIICTNRRVVIGDYTFIAHEVVLADESIATPARSGRAGSENLPRTRPGIVLNENCWIGARAVILSGTYLGENVIVGAAAVVDGEIPPNAIVAGNPARIVGWATEAPRS
jgi:acetyltransferase-like isoleucine patch superfamily enzyme